MPTINAVAAEAANTVKKFIRLKDIFICFKEKATKQQHIMISIIRLDTAPPYTPYSLISRKETARPPTVVKNADDIKLFLSFKVVKKPINTEDKETRNIDHIIIFISPALNAKLSPKSLKINNRLTANPPKQTGIENV